MIFHRGAGLVVILMMLLILPFTILTNKMFGEGYTAGHLWPASLGLCLIGILTWRLGSWLNMRDAPPPEARSKGFRAVYDAPHMFMFMRMEYWGVFYIVFGIAILFTGKW